MNKRIHKLSAAIMALAFPAMLQAQAVTSGADDNSEGTLRKEISDTPPGGTVTITLLIGTEIDLNSEIIINKSLTIVGVIGGIIDGQVNGRIFNVTADTLTLDNLTLKNGLADNGGAISVNNALLVLNACTINNSSANGASGSGGGILVGTDSRLEATATMFTNNRANRAGGAIEVNSVLDSALFLTACTFTNNKAGITPSTPAPGNGGAIHLTGAGNSYITGGLVNGNLAAAEGGGFWNGTGSMEIEGLIFDANGAAGVASNEGGGAIFNAGGSLLVKNSTFTDNEATGTAGSGGAILNDLGSLTVDTSTFTGNSSVRAGGAIEDNSPTGMTFLNEVEMDANDAGTAPGNGGGFHVTGAGNSMIKGGIFTNNQALQGGAIWNGSGTMTIDSALIDDNIASGLSGDKGGGGIYNLSGTLNIVNGTTITNNLANGVSGSGGGLLIAAGTVNIDSSFIESNSANRAGGGIEIIAGTLNINRSELLNNDCAGFAAGTPAPGSGGAIHVSGTAVTNIDSSYIEGNSAQLAGGGLWNQDNATMNLSYVSVMNNIAGQNGGGIYNTGGTMVISRSTISSNVATTNNGGGIMNNLGNLSIDHSTVSLNEAGNNGGGFYADDTLSLNAVTVYQNDAANNGGGIFGLDSVSITNSIVASNSAMLGQELDGLVRSEGYNVIENDDNSVFTAQSTDTVDVVITLGPLALNSGFTMSHSISASNVAVDRGNPSDMSKDQRGRDPLGPRDVGAYEYTANVGLAELNNADVFVVYPNPATEVINVRLASGKSGSFTITDLNGRMVMNSRMGQETSVNVSDFNAGLYLLTVKSGNSVQTKKFEIR